MARVAATVAGSSRALAALVGLAILRPRIVVLCAVAFGAIASVFGSSATGSMSNDADDFDAPGSESRSARDGLARAAGVNPRADAVALVELGEDVRSPGARERVEDVARRLADDPAVAITRTVYETQNPAWISKDGESTYVVASFEPGAAGDEAAGRLLEGFVGVEGVTLGGDAMVEYQAVSTVEEDLVRAELLAFPVLAVLLVWVFRGVVAALLPLLVGGLSVAATLFALRIVAEFAPLSVFALNIVTGLGLGLAVDYSLLIVTRYRDELARVGVGREAIRNTLATAGRTVLYSSLIVASALAALLVFPLPFLRAVGVGGVLVALLAASSALLVLPAVLSLLGTRVNALSGRRRPPDAKAREVSSGRWYRFAHVVMRRPALMAAVSAAILVAASLPALGMRFTAVDSSALPESTSARQVGDALEEDFHAGGAPPIFLAARAVADGEAPEELAGHADRIRELPGVGTVAPPRPVGGDLWRVDVFSEADPLSEESRRLVRDVRKIDAPYPAEVGGQTAEFVDQQDALTEALPLALAAVFSSTFVLLSLLSGSVVLPVKTFAMNVLTVSATFGTLVWIFQDGRLEGLLGYTSQGALENTQPIIVLVLAFALSTDYGVFLLSGIKEARDSGLKDDEAVAVGLGKTGRVVTAAALLFCVAVGAFATSDVVFVKELGVGAAVAVLIDATVVRALLVPALMKLFGRRNWWAPKRLKRARERVGLVDGERSPKMIERFSTVVLTEDLPDEELVAGDSGTVIDVYDGGTAYEIEFFALSGDTVAVATVDSKMVRFATKGDVTHSRVASR